MVSLGPAGAGPVIHRPAARGARLYIDDIRPMPVGFTHKATSYEEAVERWLSNPDYEWEFVSFDHDLAPDHYDARAAKTSYAKTGHDIAKWVEEQALLGTLKPFAWAVHSMNPEGTHRIIMAMKSADRFWREAGHEPLGQWGSITSFLEVKDLKGLK